MKKIAFAFAILLFSVILQVSFANFANCSHSIVTTCIDSSGQKIVLTSPKRDDLQEQIIKQATAIDQLTKKMKIMETERNQATIHLQEALRKTQANLNQTDISLALHSDIIKAINATNNHMLEKITSCLRNTTSKGGCEIIEKLIKEAIGSKLSSSENTENKPQKEDNQNRPAVIKKTQLAKTKMIKPEKDKKNETVQYVLAFMEQKKGDTWGNNRVIITSASGAEVTIEAPYQGILETHKILINSALDKWIAGTMRTKTGFPENKGLLITATGDISVHSISHCYASSDGFHAIPITEHSKQFMLISYPPFSGDKESRAMATIASSANGTVVHFYRKISKGYRLWERIDLKAYQTYSISSSNSTFDLTGMLVISNKPVSVFSGGACLSVPASERRCSHMEEQIPPLSSWSTQYITTPVMDQNTYSYVIRIVSAHDHNRVRIPALGIHSVVNKGDFHDVVSKRNEPVHVSCTKPCIVAQFPFFKTLEQPSLSYMLLTPPMNSYKHTYTFEAIASQIKSYSKAYEEVVIVISMFSINGLRLNKSPLLNIAARWKPVNGTDYMWGKMAVGDGTHMLTHTRGVRFLAILNGEYNEDSFGYSLGIDYKNRDFKREENMRKAMQKVKTKSEAESVIQSNEDDKRLSTTPKSTNDKDSTDQHAPKGPLEQPTQT